MVWGLHTSKQPVLTVHTFDISFWATSVAFAYDLLGAMASADGAEFFTDDDRPYLYSF